MHAAFGDLQSDLRVVINKEITFLAAAAETTVVSATAVRRSGIVYKETVRAAYVSYLAGGEAGLRRSQAPRWQPQQSLPQPWPAALPLLALPLPRRT